jgi:outer membrane immunogenic protein
MRSLALGLLVAGLVSVGISEKAAAAEATAKALVTKAPVKKAKNARTAKAQGILSNGNYDWSGVYGGFNAGYLWGTSTWNNVLPPASTMDPRVRQSMLGLHLGAQYHVRNSIPVGFVLGTEFAYSGPASGNTGSMACVFDATQTCRTRLRDLLTFGGRLGLTYEGFLLFGTGGYAQAKVTTEQLTTGACAAGLCDQTRARGWYAGTGVEYKLANIEVADVILGLEWQHIQLDATRQLQFGGVITANTRDVEASEDIIRARLSLKFNPFGTKGNGDYKIDW